MEKYQEIKSGATGKIHQMGRDSFKLIRSRDMDPFKIEIISTEFCDKIADIIASTNGAVTTMDEIVEGIRKPIAMKIDSGVYQDMLNVGERDDVELVCRYIAIERILTCSDDKGFMRMIRHARDVLKQIPLHMRHVLTSETYMRIFALIPAGYLCSVCNLTGVNVEVGKMDKSDEKTMSEIMNVAKEECGCEEGELEKAYSLVSEVVERFLFAYRDKNIIDLGNIRKVINDMFDGEMKDYFGKLIKKMNSDISDSFGKFTELVKEMKDSDSQEMEKRNDRQEPYEYDQVDLSSEMGNDNQQNPDDMNTPDVSIIDMTFTDTGADVAVNTGLEDNPQPGMDMNQPPQPDQNMQQPNPDDPNNPQNQQQNNGRVVTGLESLMAESVFRKKLKRISKESVAYVKIRGMNAPDADTLSMVIAYGYSVLERCEWYMELIQTKNDRYIVPQSYGELDSIRVAMENVLDKLLENPVVRKRNPIHDMYDIN